MIPGKSQASNMQMSLFGGQEHPLLEDIREADLNNLTPLQAIMLIQKWQSSLKDN